MWKYLFGPCLFKIFKQMPDGKKKLIQYYESNKYEWISQSLINSVSYVLTVCYYCAPIIVFNIYTTGKLSSSDNIKFYLKYIVGIATTVAGAYALRAYGRSCNEQYRIFFEHLQSALKNTENKPTLQIYDFDFHSWPVDFSWKDSPMNTPENNADINTDTDVSDAVVGFSLNPISILEYMLGHGLARPLAYPGSVKLLQAAMAPALCQGRTGLYEKGGIRAKLLAKDGNEIDTMFIDNRGASHNPRHNGDTLVICSEGNAAFYEVGAMNTPLQGGYSVLGWNTPGFMGSTGLPYPSNIQNAADVVFQYAVTKLDFAPSNIILFAWSIGGYPASYIAMKYPDVKAVILDATFDNITQLAVQRMPKFADGLVRNVIKKYMNLDVASQLIKYKGAIRLIRRQQEEVITTIPHVPSTNRGNYLLLKLLVARYPRIITKDSLDILQQYLSMDGQPGRRAVMESIGGINESDCEVKLALDDATFQQYPLNNLGEDWSVDEKMKMTLFLAEQYMGHFDATHCVALPLSCFRLPWQHQRKLGR